MATPNTIGQTVYHKKTNPRAKKVLMVRDIQGIRCTRLTVYKIILKTGVNSVYYQCGTLSNS